MRQDTESSTMEVPPFWQKLNSFFLFPFQTWPLLYAVVLALCSYLLFVPLPFFSLIVMLGLALAVSRYAFKVAALASRGVTDSSDYRSHMMEEDWKWLPWKFFAVLVVFGMLLQVVGRSEPLFWLGNVLTSLLTPAVLMVLIHTHSLRSALNPFELLGTIFGIGSSYLLLCLFLFLLNMGAPWAMVFFVRFAPAGVVLPLLAWAVIYFTWVMAAMIGYVMYQHHAELDIDPIQAPNDPQAAAVDPVAQESKRRDAEVAQLVQDGDMNEAVETAREWQRTAFDSVPDQLRYHRVLKLAERFEPMAQHAQQLIPLLMSKQQGREAIEVWTSCYKRVTGFQLKSPETALLLAQHAWKSMQPRVTLLLLQGFEKQHGAHELIPQAQELIVRALKQGENRADQALKVFMRMQARYPNHACTQEAAWILRDELQPKIAT